MTQDLWFQLGLIAAIMLSLGFGYQAASIDKEQDPKIRENKTEGIIFGGLITTGVAFLLGPIGLAFSIGLTAYVIANKFKGKKK